MERKTILIVDDSADNRAVAGLLLEHFGYSILQAADGFEAVRQAREHHPDVILMDIAMPVLDGLEATEILKVDVDTADIPVIAVTADCDPATRVRALQTGCDAFLCKPVDPHRMLQEVRHWVGPVTDAIV